MRKPRGGQRNEQRRHCSAVSITRMRVSCARDRWCEGIWGLRPVVSMFTARSHAFRLVSPGEDASTVVR